MSTSDAEMYARRASNADDVEEVGRNTRKAIEALVQTIRELEDRIAVLESKLSRR
jgi:hypothetical protein